MIQRERELEGDEFKDKEAFVTEAYKKQMEELRQAEEEERKREGTSLLVCPPIRQAHAYCRGGKAEEEERCGHRHGAFLSQAA